MAEVKPVANKEVEIEESPVTYVIARLTWKQVGDLQVLLNGGILSLRSRKRLLEVLDSAVNGDA